MREKIEYFAVKFLLFVTSLLPKKTVYWLMKKIAHLLFRFEKRRSSLTKKNLALAFPQKSENERFELAKKCYEGLSITLAEIIMMFNDRFDIDEMIVNKEETLQKLKELTKDAKNGVIIITAHFSNWELAAQFLPKNGYPMTAIGRRGNNQLIEEHFTTPFRERYGNKNVYKKNAIVKLVKALKNNEYVGLLIDQKAGGATSIKSSFFNHEADTTSSVATLKLKYNPLVIPMFIARLEDGNYKLIIQEVSEKKESSVESLTQQYNDILEDVIRAYPEQWFWMHNRWRIA